MANASKYVVRVFRKADTKDFEVVGPYDSYELACAHALAAASFEGIEAQPEQLGDPQDFFSRELEAEADAYEADLDA